MFSNKGVGYLKQEKFITTKLNCQQLEHHNAPLSKKSPAFVMGVILQHDNVKLHSAKNSRGFKFRSSTLSDLTPSNFHLFQSLQNFVNGKKIHT